MELNAHLTRQMVFSRATFGPGKRTEGVLDHIEKEMEEVRTAHRSRAAEWVDLVILSLDGLTRELWNNEKGDTDMHAQTAADEAVRMIISKQSINERRNWPDWRTADANKAIEHLK